MSAADRIVIQLLRRERRLLIQQNRSALRIIEIGEEIHSRIMRGGLHNAAV